MYQYTETNILLRFIGITEELANRIHQECVDLDVEQRKKKRGAGLVLCVYLKEDRSYKSLIDIIKNYKIEEDNYDIFVSMVTECDSDIVEIPKYVLDLIRETGSRILFSFTYVGE